jgi:hypothetical protein
LRVHWNVGGARVCWSRATRHDWIQLLLSYHWGRGMDDRFYALTSCSVMRDRFSVTSHGPIDANQYVCISFMVRRSSCIAMKISSTPRTARLRRFELCFAVTAKTRGQAESWMMAVICNRSVFLRLLVTYKLHLGGILIRFSCSQYPRCDLGTSVPSAQLVRPSTT